MMSFLFWETQKGWKSENSSVNDMLIDRNIDRSFYLIGIEAKPRCKEFILDDFRPYSQRSDYFEKIHEWSRTPNLVNNNLYQECM